MTLNSINIWDGLDKQVKNQMCKIYKKSQLIKMSLQTAQTEKAPNRNP